MAPFTLGELQRQYDSFKSQRSLRPYCRLPIALVTGVAAQATCISSWWITFDIHQAPRFPPGVAYRTRFPLHS